MMFLNFMASLKNHCKKRTKKDHGWIWSKPSLLRWQRQKLQPKKRLRRKMTRFPLPSLLVSWAVVTWRFLLENVMEQVEENIIKRRWMNVMCWQDWRLGNFCFLREWRGTPCLEINFANFGTTAIIPAYFSKSHTAFETVLIGSRGIHMEECWRPNPAALHLLLVEILWKSRSLHRCVR